MRWSSNFAYAIGLLTTDGSLSKDGRHLNFTSKDFEQVQNLVKILKLRNKISIKKSSFTENKAYYIQFGNVELYRFLLQIGLHANKSKTLGQLDIPDKYFADFLRGHLDGDGFTHSYWDKRWKSSFMLYTGFVSASKKHLEWLRKRIKNLYEINGSLKYNGKSTYQLIYAKKSSLKLIKNMYYRRNLIFLKRKKYKIVKAIEIINNQAEVLELVDRQR